MIASKAHLYKVTPRYTYVAVPTPNIGDIQALIGKVTDCTVLFDDGRTISIAQRRKIFAMVSDISAYCTAVKNKRQEREVLRELQLLYLIDTADTEAIRRQLTGYFCELTSIDFFSLSDCSMALAGEFIDWLVELAVKHDIPCNDTLLNRCEDISRYIYCCLIHKKCCISGKKAELHHVDAVGMGRDRRDIIHLGYRVMPLSRIYHTEAHSIGQKSFEEKYKVHGIKLTKELCDIWKIKG